MTYDRTIPDHAAAARRADLFLVEHGHFESRARAQAAIRAGKVRVDGRPLALAHHAGRPMVDRHCRLLDADDRPLPGVYGIGLSAGFVPWGRLGGEASFRGQANGLWLWQNDVGQMIVDQLLEAQAQAAAA